jgi:hypothetical protein
MDLWEKKMGLGPENGNKLLPVLVQFEPKKSIFFWDQRYGLYHQIYDTEINLTQSYFYISPRTLRVTSMMTSSV